MLGPAACLKYYLGGHMLGAQASQEPHDIGQAGLGQELLEGTTHLVKLL